LQGAAAAESVVEVVVGKGCLKRQGGSASGGTSGVAKKVRFALDQESEERAKLETNKLCRLPVAKDLKIVHPLTFNTANNSVKDFVAKSEKELGFTKRSSGDKRKNAGGVSFSGDSGSKAPAAIMTLGVHDERTTCMHESVSGEEFQSAKGRDVGKQPAIRGPVRRSTRRCVVAGQI